MHAGWPGRSLRRPAHPGDMRSIQWCEKSKKVRSEQFEELIDQFEGTEDPIRHPDAIEPYPDINPLAVVVRVSKVEVIDDACLGETTVSTDECDAYNRIGR